MQSKATRFFSSFALCSVTPIAFTVKSRFYVSRIYVKSRIYFEKSDDQIQNLLNKMSQFYVVSRFYVAFAPDQSYRKMEIRLYL